jgi:hypothetical protein
MSCNHQPEGHTFTYSGVDLIIDVNCRECGASGSFAVSPDEINWDDPVHKPPHYAEGAHKKWHRDGEIEIDPNTAEVSVSDDGGAYVQAWVWVSNEEAADAD